MNVNENENDTVIMIHPSHIQPDVELAAALDGIADVAGEPIKIYSDWERPTNGLPTDFITVYINGDIGGVGMKTDYADGYLMVSLYCKMNDDGSVKKNRIKKILEKIDLIIEGKTTKNYFYKYASDRFITPTTPNVASGYSITTLNLEWHTTNDFQTT